MTPDITDRPQCRAHWPDDHIEHLDGRRCKFICERRGGEWCCPVHGPQSVPEAEVAGEAPDTEQATFGEVTDS